VLVTGEGWLMNQFPAEDKNDIVLVLL